MHETLMILGVIARLYVDLGLIMNTLIFTSLNLEMSNEKPSFIKFCDMFAWLMFTWPRTILMLAGFMEFPENDED